MINIRDFQNLHIYEKFLLLEIKYNLKLIACLCNAFKSHLLVSLKLSIIFVCVDYFAIGSLSTTFVIQIN
jgi:hypothetical protein